MSSGSDRCSICHKLIGIANAVQLVFFCKCLSQYIHNIGLNIMGYKCPDSNCELYFQLDKWIVNYGIITEDELNINQDYIENELSEME